MSVLPKPLNDFFNTILESVLKPILDWILKLSWIKRVLCLLVVGLLAVIIFWRKAALEMAVNLDRYAMILTRDPSSIPLPESKKIKLNALINKISSTLVNSEYPKKDPFNDFYNTWTISQIIASCNHPLDTLSGNYSQFISKAPSHIQNCNCWSEFKSTYGHHIVTSWVMIALAKLNVKLNDTLVDYILKTQSRDGWWSVYPSVTENDASTLGTAYFTFALSKNINNTNAKPATRQKMQRAITNALTWLRGQAKSVNNLWYDYPNSGDQKEIIGINGFVLHTLNELQPAEDNREFHLNWLQNFDDYRDKNLKLTKSDLYNIKSSEQSGHTVTVDGSDAAHDNINIYNLPWFIIATADAYPDADLLTKARIIGFFEEIIDQGDDLFRITLASPSPQPWLASEFLISLREINNEKKF